MDEESIFTQTAESIAFLRLLGKVPESPSHNSHQQPDREEPGYILPLRIERDLTSALAFLSCIRLPRPSEMCKKITAVCVRERQDRGMEILIAVNARDSSESTYLKGLTKEFERLFCLLSEVDDGKYSVVLLEGYVAKYA